MSCGLLGQRFSIALFHVLVILGDATVLHNDLTSLLVGFDTVQIYSKLSLCNAENNCM